MQKKDDFFRINTKTLTVALFLSGSSVFGQSLSESAIRAIEEQRRAADRENQLRSQQERTPNIYLQGEPDASKKDLPLNEAPCFAIQSVRLVGVEQLPGWGWSGRLSTALTQPDDPVGMCLGTQGVQVLIRRLQNELIAKGLITSQVIVGPQNIKTGDLVLQIVPGRISKSQFKTDLPQVSLSGALPSSEVLDLRHIEQALENFKRVPTAEADIQIEPAAEPGMSNIVVAWQQSKRYRWGFTADDSGSTVTGKYQSSATFNYDNPLGLSDLFYFTLNGTLGGTDAGPRGTQGYTVHYSVPWQWWTFSATRSSSRYHQTVAGAFQNYSYSGATETSEIKVSRIIQRDSGGKTHLSLKGFQRQSQNYIDDTEVQVQKRVVGGFEATLGHQRNVGQASFSGNLNYKRGTGAFGSLTPPEEAFGEGTSRMQIVSADATLQAPFALGGVPFTYSANWRLQNNKTILSPQDRFVIGGRFTVRGFDGLSVLSGDKGWTIRNDLAAPVGQSGYSIYLGLDHGRVSGPNAARLPEQQLAGAVLGVRGRIGPIQWDAFAGKPISHPQNINPSSHVAGFTLNANF